MKFSWTHISHIRWISAVFLVCLLAGYVVLQHTSMGRVVGLYTVGGWKAPWSVRTECRHTALARVETLFTKPLAMSGDATGGLREYWHYSYYRECLYRAGYSFMGSVLPESTLYALGENEQWYVNPLAGVYLRVSPGAHIVRDNEFDVAFDPQLLRSELVVASTTLHLDAYTQSQYVKTFSDLPGYLEHFTTSTSTITSYESATTTGGIPYLSVQQDSDVCGMMMVTPDTYILHLSSSCSVYEKVRLIFDTLKLIPAVSVH